jgi:hypothetical protein
VNDELANEIAYVVSPDGVFRHVQDGCWAARNVDNSKLLLVRKADNAILAFIKEPDWNSRRRLERLARSLEAYPGERVQIHRR